MLARLGKTVFIFLAGYLTCALGFDFVAKARAAGGTPSLQNGDVNGDSVLNLTDAVYLLNYLFASGAPIKPIECEGTPPPPKKAKVRFGVGVLCDGAGVTGTLDFCGVRVSNTSVPGSFNPSACTEVEAKTSCAVRVTAATAGCGNFEFCTTVSAEEDDVFDFVFFFDGEPLLGLFKQKVNGQGQCPAFPMPGAPFTQVIRLGCPAGVAALNAGGDRGDDP